MANTHVKLQNERMGRPVIILKRTYENMKSTNHHTLKYLHFLHDCNNIGEKEAESAETKAAPTTSIASTNSDKKTRTEEEELEFKKSGLTEEEWDEIQKMK